MIRFAEFARKYWHSFFAAGVAGALLAAVGAFGTGTEPLAARLTFWIPLMLIGTAGGFAVALRARRRPKVGENPLIVWSMTTALATVPGSLLVWGYMGVIFRQTPDSFALLVAEVAVVSGAMSAIMLVINRPGVATSGPMPAAQGTPAQPVRFLQRLPAKLAGATLYAIESEDHYLRLRTSKGSDLILMRLADAMAELDGIEGAQVHRSWWVARAAVERVVRSDRRVTLHLKDGAEVPVSRPNIAALRQSGWL